MSTLIETKYGKANINSKGYYHIVSSKENNFGKKLHRLVYEDHHNCTLLPDTDIHHIDGDKLNNDIDNLQAISHADHSREHMIGDKNPMKDKTHTQEDMVRMSAMKSNSGYFRVSKKSNKGMRQGFSWCYQYYEDGKRKRIQRKTIQELEKAVKDKDLLWIKFSEEQG